MTAPITESPGLAVTGNVIEPKKRRHRATKLSTLKAREALKQKTLAERAKALRERKNPTYRLILKVDEETYAAVVALGERASLVAEEAAIRALREGLARFEDISLQPLPTIGMVRQIPSGETNLAPMFEENLNPYIPEDIEAKKRLIKAIGLQTNG